MHPEPGILFLTRCLPEMCGYRQFVAALVSPSVKRKVLHPHVGLVRRWRYVYACL